jgi:hypothetical protein
VLTVASLLAAMTIAGAFWVGVLAARRLRDWGEGRRALEDGGHTPLAIAATSGAPPDDARTRRIRELVAHRLQHHRHRPGPIVPRQLVSGDANARSDELGLANLRSGDVVDVQSGEPEVDGDYLVEGIVLLREGNLTTTVVAMADAGRRRWLVGGPHHEQWIVVDPIEGHGLSGEPPRNIRRDGGDFTLTRRGQASAACTGRHGRPEQPRAATYLYTASANAVLWVERWASEIVMGKGRFVEPTAVTFLPGS